MADTVETAIYRLRVEGEEQIKQLTASIEGMATAEEDATKSNRNLTQQIQRSLTAMDPLLKVQAQYTKSLELNARARESGAASEQELNAHLQGITQNYQRSVSAIQGYEKATGAVANTTKGARYELINLSRQFQDVGVSLAGGQSPFMVLMQQGSQIVDVFASSERKVSEIFKSMGAGIVAFITNPVTLAIGVVTGLGAAFLYAANAADKLQVSSQRAIGGAGARSGTTVEDINTFVTQQSATGKGAGVMGLSDTQARELAEGFTKSGDIVISKLHDVGTAVQGFANQTGKSVDDTIKAFEAFGRDPVKALDAFSETFGNLGQRQQEAFERAMLLGDKTAALNVVIDAYSEATKRAAENTTFLERRWNDLASVFGRGMQQPAGIDTQIANLKKQIETAKDAIGSGFGGMPTDAIDNMTAALAKLEAQAAKTKAEAAGLGQNLSAGAALAHAEFERMLPVISAVTDRERIAAQYAADYYNALAKSVPMADALQAAADKKAASEAAANAGIDKQIKSLEQSTRMIKAQQDGTERTVAAAIAYENAIDSGADATRAAAVSAATLANYTQRAANSAGNYAALMQRIANFNSSGDPGISASTFNQGSDSPGALSNAMGIKAFEGGSWFGVTGELIPAGGGGGAMVNPDSYTLALYKAGQKRLAEAAAKPPPTAGELADQYLAAGGINYAIQQSQAAGTPDLSTISSLYSLQNQGLDKGAQASNLQQELAWLRTQPETLARDQAMSQLVSSIEELTTSTDSLNVTNQELLSPYYTQDPRTSHIGFRSQGMASGGYVDVPGGVSSNDNLLATIPVASGERIYVDPMTGRRGTSGGGMVINISSPITINGNANADQFGRTVFQANQQLAKSVRAAAQ